MTPDQAQLLEMADESLAAARLLLENDYPGFAASRAYYAMFLAAEALLLSKEMSFSKHSAVIAAFGQHFARTGLVPAELHRFILTGQDHRHIADYGGERRVEDDEAKTDIQHAEAFLQVAKGFLGGQDEAKEP